MTLTVVENLIAAYLGKAVVDFTLQGQNTVRIAVNTARRRAERAHDFRYSETTGFISLPSTGGLLTAVYAVSGLTGDAIGVKRVQTVSLPIASSQYQPVEFMTNDELDRRVKRQIGRKPFNASETLTSLGVSTDNTLVFQHGQSLFQFPYASTLTAKLDLIRWMPDYDQDADEDFILQYGGDYLMWQGILETNKYWKRFAEKQEGSIDESAIEQQANTALATLVEWDRMIARSSTTPPTEG